MRKIASALILHCTIPRKTSLSFGSHPLYINKTSERENLVKRSIVLKRTLLARELSLNECQNDFQKSKGIRIKLREKGKHTKMNYFKCWPYEMVVTQS